MPRQKKNVTDEAETIVADVAEMASVDNLPLPLPTRAKRKGVDRLAQINAIASKVFAKEGTPLVEIDAASLRHSKPHLPSGSTVLDSLIGGRPNRFGIAPCPGWPKGAISNIFGPESSGKTTVALSASAETCGRGGQTVFIDWEHAISPDYAAAIGVPITDPAQFALYQPNTLEDGLKILWLAAKAGVELVILDSIGAGVPKAVFGQSLEEQGSTGRVGLLASIWGVFLPKLMALASDSGTHVMGISQLRKKINTGGPPGGGHGPDTTTQGGEAWKFYSAVRMDFHRIKSLKTRDYDALTHKNVERFTSAIIKAKMIKSKVAATQQAEAEFYITFGRGIDDMMSVIDIATAHGLIHKGGAWYTWERGNGDTLKAQGVEDLRKQVMAAAGGWDELKAGVVRSMSSGRAIEMAASVVEEEEPAVDMDDILGTKPKPAEEDDGPGGAADPSSDE